MGRRIKDAVGRHDWYRRTTWTAEDQDAFWARFNRSRSASSKAQYLLIQARYLIDADLVTPALALVDRVFQEGTTKYFLSDAHHTRALCLVSLGRLDEAVLTYRLSLDARRAHPGMQNLAYLDFAWFIVGMERIDLYDEALQVLDEFSGGAEIFPIHAYRNAGARAVLWAAKGDERQAAVYARAAIAASSKSETPFRYHRELGLVNEIDSGLHTRLFALAAGQPGVAPDGALPRR